ncbi:hypothetical protein ACWEPC_05220 [Nonomuraea sp. NPDC004297]
MKVIIDSNTGCWWAAQLEQEVHHWWQILWEPGGQHLTAYFRGHWQVGGVYRKGRDPHELWPLMRDIQGKARRLAANEAVPVPPVLAEHLPDALWRAAGR